jgi:chemotaxis response regulator CheB
VTIAQDEQSSMIFGMPRAAIALNAAQQVLAPPGISRSLNALHVERVRSLI